MIEEYIPFARPEIGDEEIEEVSKCLREGWITTGPRTATFEKSFAEYLGGNIGAVAVNSATAGLHLVLEALGIGPGDEVIVPTYTFTATAEVIRYLGATPVFVDVAVSDFNISPEAVKEALSPRTRAIMVVHFAGLACQMTELFELASRCGIPIVEDAAHALPTTYRGRLIGTLPSAATVFSFYANKTMSTGEGGMITSADSTLLARCRVMRLHGINRDIFTRYVDRKPSWFYEVVAPGYKYNLTDIASAIGLHQLVKLPRFQQRREYLANRYNVGLQGTGLVLPANAPEGEIHARHLYPIRLPIGGINRDAFIAAMSARGVGCSVHFIPLHLHPYWLESCKLARGQFPVAEQLYSSEVSLPLYSSMTDSQQDRVINETKDIVSR